MFYLIVFLITDLIRVEFPLYIKFIIAYKAELTGYGRGAGITVPPPQRLRRAKVTHSGAGGGGGYFPLFFLLAM